MADAPMTSGGPDRSRLPLDVDIHQRPIAPVTAPAGAPNVVVVLIDDKIVRNYAVSYGKESVPGRATVSGIHVVTEKFPEFTMCNPQFDYCNLVEKWAVRINNNGEFIHANPASSGAQGNANVTHGCVNLSLSDAHDYFNSAIWGDPVEVTGTSINLGPDDGDLYDWAMTWDQWRAISVA